MRSQLDDMCSEASNARGNPGYVEHKARKQRIAEVLQKLCDERAEQTEKINEKRQNRLIST